MTSEWRYPEPGDNPNLFRSRLKDALLGRRYHTSTPWDDTEGRKLSKRAYLTGLLVLVICSYSQYLLGAFPSALGTLFVYGVPVTAAGVLFGRPIMSGALSHNRGALRLGLGLFGIFLLLGELTGALVLQGLAYIQPDAANLLNRPNPVLNVPEEYAWLMVIVSIIVVGPAEEFLFRGFVYGGLLNLYRGNHWIKLAFVSSLIFAAVHIYYALVYGYASIVAFILIVSISMGLSATYYLSGGNLLIPALLHGAYDAAGFIGVAVSPRLGTSLRGLMVMVGIIVAVSLAIRFRRPIEA